MLLMVMVMVVIDDGSCLLCKKKEKEKSLLTCSTCSNVKPLVSGTKSQAKIAQRAQVEPQMKKTLTPKSALS